MIWGVSYPYFGSRGLYLNAWSLSLSVGSLFFWSTIYCAVYS